MGFEVDFPEFDLDIVDSDVKIDEEGRLIPPADKNEEGGKE
jgi:hypothetical protein